MTRCINCGRDAHHVNARGHPVCGLHRTERMHAESYFPQTPEEACTAALGWRYGPEGAFLRLFGQHGPTELDKMAWQSLGERK
jgi:ribosomal protein L37E